MCVLWAPYSPVYQGATPRRGICLTAKRRLKSGEIRFQRPAPDLMVGFLYRMSDSFGMWNIMGGAQGVIPPNEPDSPDNSTPGRGLHIWF